MKRTVRLLLAGLALAGGLTWQAPEAEAAPAGPASATAPAQEASPCNVIRLPNAKTACYVLEKAFVAMKVGETLGLSFSGFLDAFGGPEAFAGLGAGGELNAADYGICAGTCNENVEHFIIDANQRLKEAAKADENFKEAQKLLCTWWPSMNGCTVEADPETYGENPAYSGYPGGALYSGPVEAVWRTTAGSQVGRTVVLAWEPTFPAGGDMSSSTGVITWRETGTDNYVRLEAHTAGRYPDPPGSVRFRLCDRWPVGNSGSCTALTPPQPLTGWTEGGAVVGIRLKAITGDCYNNCWSTLELVTPGSVIESTINWSRFDRIGVNAVGWNLGDSELHEGGFIQDYADVPLSTLVEKIGRFDPTQAVPLAEAPLEVPNPWVDPEDDNPDFRTKPSIVPGEDPTTPPDPIIPPAPEEVPNTTIPDPATEIEEQTNRQAGFFDNLASAIGSGLSWLGDVFGYWIRWLWERLGNLIRWLGDSLIALLEWIGDLLNIVIDWLRIIRDVLRDGLGALANLLQKILDAVGALPAGLMDLLRALWDLPELLWEAFKDGLQELFIPDAPLVALEGCDTSFPCSWVTEMADGLGGIASGVAGAAGGSCTTPSIGWDEFRASFPPPPGCAVAAGAEPLGPEASNAGDLWGFRVAFRLAALAAFSIWFVMQVVSMSPWSESQHYRFNPEQQTLFD